MWQCKVFPFTVLVSHPRLPLQNAMTHCLNFQVFPQYSIIICYAQSSLGCLLFLFHFKVFSPSPAQILLQSFRSCGSQCLCVGGVVLFHSIISALSTKQSQQKGHVGKSKDGTRICKTTFQHKTFQKAFQEFTSQSVMDHLLLFFSTCCSKPQRLHHFQT